MLSKCENFGAYLPTFRYESLLGDYEKQTLLLLQFLHFSPDPEERDRLWSHFRRDKPGYLSTYREHTTWDRERWRRELTEEQLELIQQECGQEITDWTMEDQG